MRDTRNDVEETRLRSLASDLDDLSREMDLHEVDPAAPMMLKLVDRASEFIGVVLMVAVTALIFVNAFGRYAFDRPLNWADELVIALIPWLAMTGLFLSIRRGSVIRIEFFYERLPAAIKPAVAVFVTFLSAAAFLYLAFYSFQYVQLFGADVTTYLRLERGWFTSALLIGSLASAGVFIAQALGLLRARRVAGRNEGAPS